MSDLTNPLIAEHIGPYYVYLPLLRVSARRSGAGRGLLRRQGNRLALHSAPE